MIYRSFGLKGTLEIIEFDSEIRFERAATYGELRKLCARMRALAIDDQPRRQRNGDRERQRNAGDAGVPAEMVEQLTEHRAADEATRTGNRPVDDSPTLNPARVTSATWQCLRAERWGGARRQAAAPPPM